MVEPDNEEAEIYDTNSFDFVNTNQEFINELRKNEVDCHAEIDTSNYCKRIFKSDELEVIKHSCGCVSDDKRTLSFARKIGRKIGQEMIDKLTKLREKCK